MLFAVAELLVLKVCMLNKNIIVLHTAPESQKHRNGFRRSWSRSKTISFQSPLEHLQWNTNVAHVRRQTASYCEPRGIMWNSAIRQNNVCVLGCGIAYIQATLQNVTEDVFNWNAEFIISAKYNFNTRTEFRDEYAAPQANGGCIWEWMMRFNVFVLSYTATAHLVTNLASGDNTSLLTCSHRNASISSAVIYVAQLLKGRPCHMRLRQRQNSAHAGITSLDLQATTDLSRVREIDAEFSCLLMMPFFTGRSERVRWHNINIASSSNSTSWCTWCIPADLLHQSKILWRLRPHL